MASGVNNEQAKIAALNIGRDVAWELAGNVLRPNSEELKKVAEKLGISVAKARKSLNNYIWEQND